MKNGYGQEVRWVLEKDMLAYLKETQTPEKYAEIEAWHKRFHEEHKPKPVEIPVRDSEGRIVSSVTVQTSGHSMIPAEMITDPWTGQPKVFTEEEKAEYDLANRGWTPERRESVASFECKICNRLLGEHSAREFDDCQAQIEAPTHRLFPKGRRAKKETIAHCKCTTCGRQYGEHSQQEYDACINQDMKRNKPKQERLRYVKCEICSRKFGEHSSQEYEACIDQLIENSV
jgi:hypothetical protein